MAADDLAAEFEGLSFNGLKLQHFDPARDDEDADAATKESYAVKAKELVKFVAPNMALGMVTGPIGGIALGVGRVAAAKAQAKLHDRLAKGEGILCTVTAMNAKGLYERTTMGKISPFVTAKVEMEGTATAKKMANSGKCKPLHNAGGSFTYPVDEHKFILGLPPSLEEAKNAILLIKVKDEPDAMLLGKLAGKAGLAELTLGTAVLTLAQLVEGLEEHEHVECEVNVKLSRGKDYSEDGGVVRLKVALDAKSET